MSCLCGVSYLKESFLLVALQRICRFFADCLSCAVFVCIDCFDVHVHVRIHVRFGSYPSAVAIHHLYSNSVVKNPMLLHFQSCCITPSTHSWFFFLSFATTCSSCCAPHRVTSSRFDQPEAEADHHDRQGRRPDRR